MNPKPYWILRHHGSSSVRSLHYADGLLAIGDDKGTVSLVDLVTFRPRFQWSAHADSVLTVLVIDAGNVLTHARDNSVKLWKLPDLTRSIGSRNRSGAASDPELVRTIGVNALNFSKCSLSHPHLAVPNALDAAYIDIIDLSTGVRVHEAIGRPDITPTPGRRDAIVMALHLLPDAVLAGYEDGYVKKWSPDTGHLVWQARCHSESVMAMCVAPRFGVSVAADDRLTRFELQSGETHLVQTSTPGHASVAIAPDAATLAVGAWSGGIDVYSATTPLSQLGSLRYHRDTVECLAFAHVPFGDHDDDQDDSDQDDAAETQLILAAGGRDGKVSLWKYH